VGFERDDARADALAAAERVDVRAGAFAMFTRIPTAASETTSDDPP
jgi:hypothetical protein